MRVEHKWKRLGVIVLLATITACAPVPRQRPLGIGDVEGSLPEARKFLEGRWILESFELRPAGKPPILLKGSGVLNYDDFGNLHMEVKADQDSSDLLRASGIEIRDGVISSDGRTVIDLPNRTLTYFIEGQRSSTVTGGGPLALNRPRHWDVNGDMLTLTIMDDAGLPSAISRWKKTP